MWPALNVYRNLLSFLVKRLLGRFLLDPAGVPGYDALDADQLSLGQIKLSSLRLAPSALAPYLPLTGVEVDSVTLDDVTLTIETPISWSSLVTLRAAGVRAKLHVTLEHVEVNDRLSFSKELTTTLLEEATEPMLRQSVVSLAESLSEDEPSLPGAFIGGRGPPAQSSVAEPVDQSMLARALHALLSRLRVDTTDIRIDLTGVDGEVFTLDVGRISAASTPSPATTTPSAAQSSSLWRVEVGDLQVRLVKSEPGGGAPQGSPDSASSNESTYDMAMSQAVFDVSSVSASAAAAEAEPDRRTGRALPASALLCVHTVVIEASPFDRGQRQFSFAVGRVSSHFCPANLRAVRNVLDSIARPGGDEAETSGPAFALSMSMSVEEAVLVCAANDADSARLVITVRGLNAIHASSESRMEILGIRISIVNEMLACDVLVVEPRMAIEGNARRELAPALRLSFQPAHHSISCRVACLVIDGDITVLLGLGPLLDDYSSACTASDVTSVGTSTNDKAAAPSFVLPDLAIEVDALRFFVTASTQRTTSITPIMARPTLLWRNVVVHMRSDRSTSVTSASMSVWPFREEEELEELEPSAPPLFRVVGIGSQPGISASHFGPQYACRLQSAHVDLTKPVLDSLQVFADAVTRLAVDVSRGRHDGSGEIQQQPGRCLTFSLERLDVGVFTSNGRFRRIGIHVDKLDLRFSMSSKAELVVDLDALAITATHRVAATTEHVLISQTLAAVEPAPMLRVSWASPGRAGASYLKVHVHGVTYHLCHDGTLLRDLADLIRAPEGVFDAVAPTPRTCLTLELTDTALVSPTGRPTIEAAYAINRLTGQLEIQQGATDIDLQISAQRTHLYLREHNSALDRASAARLGGADIWLAEGWISMVTIRDLNMAVTRRLASSPSLSLAIRSGRFGIECCADSLPLLASLAPPNLPPSPRSQAYDIRQGDIEKHAPYAAEADASDRQVDFIESLDHMILDESPRRITMLRSSRSDDATLRNARSLRRGLHVTDAFLLRRAQARRAAPSVRPVASTVSASGCALQISLYSGFELHSTRERIRRDIAQTRRRLLRIRQTIADGQVPDETATEASFDLRQTVYLPAAGLGDDIDEMLEVLGGEEDDWQAVASLADNGKVRAITSVPERLVHPRSNRHAVAIDISGIRIEYQAFVAGGPIDSQMQVTAQTFDIIDNLASSTWHKFMTEMRVGDGGVARPTDAPVFRIDVTEVHVADERVLTGFRRDSEIKVKVLPLRLYADQDVLDFFKTFVAPQGSESVSDTQADSPSEAFIARFEVYPVRLKLDYKPKRVDYHALRRGRTMELMNFFSFEGSEMTLRHVVLSGVQGWPRLSQLLQDIWTPDVKANQLADFLAGLTPVRSLVNVGNGVADLVLLPMEQYRRHGHLGRGLQRGLASLTRASAQEAARLTARLASGTQVILEQAETVLGGRGFNESASVNVTGADEGHARTSKYAQQPSDLRKGISAAATTASGSMRAAAQTILALPLEVYESGSEGSVRAVIRAMPVGVLLGPAIGATGAARNVLLGAANQMSPDLTPEDKYKRR